MTEMTCCRQYRQPKWPVTELLGEELWSTALLQSKDDKMMMMGCMNQKRGGCGGGGGGVAGSLGYFPWIYHCRDTSIQQQLV